VIKQKHYLGGAYLLDSLESKGASVALHRSGYRSFVSTLAKELHLLPNGTI